MNTVTLEINGTTIDARPGQTILEVVEEYRLDRIPTLCHSPELKPYASCFLCVVEIAGRPGLAPACATPVARGMKITTRNERIVRSRRTALELLLSNHYADCLAPCTQGCPAHVDVQGYIALANMGQYGKAVDLIRETNPLPGICGRICVRKCEVVCRRLDVDAPVGINNIKRYVTDTPEAFDHDPRREPSRGKSVGIVGSGPAGLTAAWFLGRRGYDPVIYEALPAPGGMLRYGIPEYRLPKAGLDQEVDYICKAGAEIRCNVRVGRDVTLDRLRSEHDAVFLAPGAMGGKGMMVKGEEQTPGVVRGVDFLLEKTEKPEPMSGTVVVIGGGNTAVDVARTAWRLGADKVIVLYRRTRAEMPADEVEVVDMLEEGIELMELMAPVGIVRKEDGSLRALRCVRMTLGAPDASGRRRPVPQEGSDFDLPCDWAMPSIGQTPMLEEMLTGQEAVPGVSRWTTFDIDTMTMATNVDGLYAGGDAADDGPTVVIDAIRDGQRAARAIHSFLSGEPLEREPFAVSKEFWSRPGQKELGEIPQSPRHEVRTIPVEERKGSFAEVAVGYDDEDMEHEARRCLSCGCLAFDWCDLRLLAEEYEVDMNHFKGYVRKHKVDDRHPYVIYDPNKCILCARCIRTCERVLPISALGLINRGFQAEMRPAMNDPLVETSCISCGNCIDACPTGAISAKFAYEGRAALDLDLQKSHCGFCSIGCPITVCRISDSRYFMRPSGVAGEYLCHDGRFGAELFIRGKRLDAPRLREGQGQRAISHEEAYRRAADGLRAAAAAYGPEAVGVFLYPDVSNEEMYLAGRIAREGLGTNNITSIALLETGGTSGALDESFGFTGSTADRTALRDADLVICNNIDPQSFFLILGTEIIDAAKAGAKLVVTGSTRQALADMADLYLDPLRGTAARFWNCVTRALIEGNHFPREMIESMPGGKAFLAHITAYDATTTCQITGVEGGQFQKAAEMIAVAKRVVLVHSPDRSRDLAPGDLQVLANLALLIRARGASGELILPSLAANGAGLEVCGADPAFTVGRVPARGFPGAKTREELFGMLREGKIKAALVISEDPMSTDRVASYFGGVEFLTAVDWAQTETTLFADVAIPGSTFLEGGGTRCNFEGRVLHYRPAVKPPAGVAGWQVLAGLAGRLGLDVPDNVEALTAGIAAAAAGHLGPRLPFLWNTGQTHAWDGSGSLVVADASAHPYPRVPAFNAGALYRRSVREVGIEHFRVGVRQ
jgi:formate dehydrogenase major subunit